MDFLDAVIIVVVAIGAFSGFRRGFSWIGPSMVGLLVGLLVGALVAPPIARAISHNVQVQPLIALGFFLAITLLIQGIGTGIGFQARLRAMRTRLAGLDSSLGAVLSILSVIAGVWYLGLTFSQVPQPGVVYQIDNSRILRALDSIVPRPPGFLASIQNILRGSNFPNPFSSIEPNLLGPVQIPPLVNTPGIRSAASATSKVIATGCGGGAEAGSSWPVATDYLVTNAHVVAGSQHVDVITTNNSTHSATVVLFDPNVDIAVLHVPGSGLPALPTTSTPPARGTTGAVVGYPGGGPEKVVSAAVRGTETAEGYNIYGDQLVTRQIEVLAAQIIPGNSGGPIVETSGRVVGVVFAASTTNSSEGYALTQPQVADDLRIGVGRTQAVSTENCTS